MEDSHGFAVVVFEAFSTAAALAPLKTQEHPAITTAGLFSWLLFSGFTVAWIGGGSIAHILSTEAQFLSKVFNFTICLILLGNQLSLHLMCLWRIVFFWDWLEHCKRVTYKIHN